MPPPVKNLQLDPMIEGQLVQALSCSVVGGPEKIKSGIAAFAKRTGAEELMVAGSIFDHAKRVRSFEIAAQAIS